MCNLQDGLNSSMTFLEASIIPAGTLDAKPSKAALHVKPVLHEKWQIISVNLLYYCISNSIELKNNSIYVI